MSARNQQRTKSTKPQQEIKQKSINNDSEGFLKTEKLGGQTKLKKK